MGRPHQVQVVERTRVPGGFHIGFRGPQSAVEAVESLVTAERECCSWADWQVQAIGHRSVLHVTGPDTLIEKLASAFGLAGDGKAGGPGKMDSVAVRVDEVCDALVPRHVDRRTQFVDAFDSQSVRVRVDVLAAQADLELRIARR